MTDRPAHAEKCPFFFEQQEKGESDHAAPMTPRVGNDKPEFLASVETLAAPKAASDPTGRDNGHRAASQDSVARRMLWILSQAGINQFPKKSHGHDVATILEMAAAVEIGQGIRLKDVLYCSPKAWLMRWMTSGFDRCASHGLAEQVWWLCPIDSVRPDKSTVRLAATGDWVHVAGALNVFGGAIDEVRFPMLMCAMVRRVSGVVSIARAYCHPIAHQNWWCPVDSHHVRLALEDLVGVMKWLHKEKSIDLHLLKPVDEWRGTGAVPDFVLTMAQPKAHAASTNADANLVVETMGYDDSEYLERKLRTMTKLGAFEIFQDQRAAIEPAAAGQRLRSGVSKWAIRTAVSSAISIQKPPNHLATSRQNAAAG